MMKMVELEQFRFEIADLAEELKEMRDSL